MIELNIRLDSKVLPNTTDDFNQRKAIALRSLRRFGPVQYRLETARFGAIQRLCVAIEADAWGVRAIHNLAERLGQECISVYCPERNEGTVIGPGAEKWLPFTMKRFRRYDDDLNVPPINTFDPCLGEDAQQMHDRLTPKELTLQPGSKQRLQTALREKQTAFDPIENAMRRNPALTRERAEADARAAGF